MSGPLALVELVAKVDRAFDGGLASQLQWLEDAAAALEVAELGDDGRAAALDLRAALGAVVLFSRDASNARDPKALLELEAVVRAHTARGLLTLYRAVAAGLHELAQEKGPSRAQVNELALAFDALVKGQERGEAPSAAALRRLEEVRASLR